MNKYENLLLFSGETPAAGASRGAARTPRRRLRGPSSLPVAQLRSVEQVELHAVNEFPHQAACRYADRKGFRDNWVITTLIIISSAAIQLSKEMCVFYRRIDKRIKGRKYHLQTEITDKKKAPAYLRKRCQFISLSLARQLEK